LQGTAVTIGKSQVEQEEKAEKEKLNPNKPRSIRMMNKERWEEGRRARGNILQTQGKPTQSHRPINQKTAGPGPAYPSGPHVAAGGS